MGNTRKRAPGKPLLFAGSAGDERSRRDAYGHPFKAFAFAYGGRHAHGAHENIQ
jgi:hypothetical protein